MPYRDRNFRSKFEFVDAVFAGTRPTALSDAHVPVDYVSLMVDCWNAEPDQRLAFRQVVERLEDIHDRILIPKDSSVLKFGTLN